MARLESENRAVRQQLDLVLSSKGRRAFLMAGHPLWTLRAGAARLLYLKPVAAARELWKEFRSHRISLSSAAQGGSGAILGNAKNCTRPPAQWSRELGIGGEVHEGLLCDVGSRFTFTTPAGPGSRLRVSCALLPQDWETSSASVEFKVTVRAHSGAERSALRVLTPSIRWSDRRWRSLDIAMPTDASGDVVVTLETRALGTRPHGRACRLGRADRRMAENRSRAQAPRPRARSDGCESAVSGEHSSTRTRSPSRRRRSSGVRALGKTKHARQYGAG